MSKFEDLRQSYVDARAGYFARRNACTKLATILVQGLEAHIQSPSFKLQFLPYSGEAYTNKNQTGAAAAWLASDNCWHYRVGLEVSDATPGVFTKDAARQMIVIELVLQPDGDAFKVRVNGWDDKFALPAEAGTPEQAVFNEFVFKQMAGTYEKLGQKFFEGQEDAARMVCGPA